MSSSNPSNASTTADLAISNFREAFKTYLTTETDVVSLNRFHQFTPEIILQHSNFNDIKGTWNHYFVEAVKELGVKVEPLIDQVTIELEQAATGLDSNYARAFKEDSCNRHCIPLYLEVVPKNRPTNHHVQTQLTKQ
ncbi:hypothetical protein BDB00DRAFT_793816 [Zychaea mexicana]|uniref:uncharacterized protein n=1 Tax=Zychaea mexicana TaxID=64656 RepID=UPI0022FEC8B1|nr:uncharacterized protein BDB00DRAFT_793816 [Zychaea mexicana]KAI9467654.1 hypothetical protein BDB00DRAFT_793816 [Zychaea mexicana]